MSFDGDYTRERAENEIDVLRAAEEKAERAIKEAADEGVLYYLIRDQTIDIDHDGNQGIGSLRREILETDHVPEDLKREVINRDDDTPTNILVPDDVHRNARIALRVGKPVVLYGPTGTGKTTFAKQLALESSVGYSLNTAPLLDSQGYRRRHRTGGFPNRTQPPVPHRTRMCLRSSTAR